MFYSDYSQFLDPELTTLNFGKSSKEYQFEQSCSFPIHDPHHDLVYSEFTEVPYPTSFTHFNPFCPLCLKFIENGAPSTTCYINNERNYLIHQECLLKNKSYELRNVGELIENNTTIEQCEPINKFKFQFALDPRQFYLELTLTHPINEKNFVKINKKVSIISDHLAIIPRIEEFDSLIPNIILVPLTDYHITVTLSQLKKKGNVTKFTKYLSLKYLKDNKRYRVKCDEILLEVEVIRDREEKVKLIEMMNYKFRYQIDDTLPILRINECKVKLPDQFEEEDQGFNMANSTSIVDQLLKEKESSMRASQRSSLIVKACLGDSHSTNETSQLEKVNLVKLISTNSLIEFVKNNNQSRIFQDYLLECKPQELQQIIYHIKQRLNQLITHEYGNYMVQKLFIVCQLRQRVEILQVVMPQLIELVKNKQGTHTIQAFLTHFTSNEQFAMVSIEIMKDFYNLCRNSNSTHFIQKIIKTFPLEYTIGFFHYIAENLMSFALDKNAMCVIKHMMRRLRELDGLQESYNFAIDQVRRQIIAHVTYNFNVDKLIMDSYGNYVIQFCYELFDIDKCSGITERILSRFESYSLGKYSSNVLLKCVSTYWVDKRVYQSLKGISSKQVLQIFRNKDGNKVLLEMMEKLEGTQVWYRLYGILIQVEPSKFYHDRWGVCLGCRSGQVGTHLLSFPDARKKTYIKKY